MLDLGTAALAVVHQANRADQAAVTITPVNRFEGPILDLNLVEIVEEIQAAGAA